MIAVRLSSPAALTRGKMARKEHPMCLCILIRMATAKQGMRTGDLVRGVEVVLEELGQADVADLGGAVPGQQHVLGLQVRVQHLSDAGTKPQELVSIGVSDIDN